MSPGGFADGYPMSAALNDTCLYVATIGPQVVLGLLYSEDIEVDDVRRQVVARKAELAATL